LDIKSLSEYFTGQPLGCQEICAKRAKQQEKPVALLPKSDTLLTDRRNGKRWKQEKYVVIVPWVWYNKADPST
jgi:hypothetical protein